MNPVKIELPERDWKEYKIQGIKGQISKVKGVFRVDVEVMELPGEYVDYNYVCPFELNDSMIGKMVVGDIGRFGFHILVLCLIDDVKIFR
jgi:hypothetical protein